MHVFESHDGLEWGVVTAQLLPVGHKKLDARPQRAANASVLRAMSETYTPVMQDKWTTGDL